MLCTNCKTKPAVFYYEQNIGGKKSSVSLCAECAGKIKAPASNFAFFKPFFGAGESTVKIESQKACNLCGLRFNDIRSMGKVGCPECYNTFKHELEGIIKQIHGSAKHCGSTPRNATLDTHSPLSEEEKLKSALNDAIHTENYEEAARLRDAIKALKGENNGKN